MVDQRRGPDTAKQNLACLIVLGYSGSISKVLLTGVFSYSFSLVFSENDRNKMPYNVKSSFSCLNIDQVSLRDLNTQPAA